MPFAANHAAPEVEAAVARHVRGMNASRYIPETPAMFREAAVAHRLYIFNVGPWSHRRECGSAGNFIIPACPEGKPYSDPVVIDGVVQEPYPINEAECKMLQSDGLAFAQQILGEGPFVPKSSSFAPFGVFISPANPPADELVTQARQKLNQKFVEICAEASDAWAQGNQAARETIRPEWHFVAARALKKSAAECPWLANTAVPAQRENCPGCGSIYNIGIIKCATCGYILDRAKFDKAVKEGRFSA